MHLQKLNSGDLETPYEIAQLCNINLTLPFSHKQLVLVKRPRFLPGFFRVPPKRCQTSCSIGNHVSDRKIAMHNRKHLNKLHTYSIDHRNEHDGNFRKLLVDANRFDVFYPKPGKYSEKGEVDDFIGVGK